MNSKQPSKLCKRQNPIDGLVGARGAVLGDELAGLLGVDGAVREHVAPVKLQGGGGFGGRGGPPRAQASESASKPAGKIPKWKL